MTTSNGGPARPATVDRSVQLWIIAAVAYVIAAIVNLLIRDQIQQAALNTLRQAGLNVDPNNVNTGSGAASIIVQLIIAIIWLALVFALRGGANWARIVLTVLGVIGIVLTLIGLLAAGILISTGIGGIIVVILDIVMIITAIVGMVFMYRGQANPYFAKQQHA